MYGNDLEIVPGRRFEKIRTGAFILLHEIKLYLEGVQYLEGIERTRNVSCFFCFGVRGRTLLQKDWFAFWGWC